jgi:hypothetical protein
VKLPVSEMAMKVRSWSISSIAVMAADPEMAHFRAGVTISSFLIDQIKNIRFTNQSPQCNIFGLPEESGGDFGWFWAAPIAILAP